MNSHKMNWQNIREGMGIRPGLGLSIGSRLFTVVWNRFWFFFLGLSFSFAPMWCQVTPKGKRLLSVALNQPETGGFELSMAKAKEVGAQVVSIPLQWDENESEPGVFGSQPNWLAIANQYYPTRGMKLVLGINPIDTGRLRLPDDLAKRAFDDPLVIRRFKALLDWALSQVPDIELAALVIGNEIDGYLGADAVRWRAYTRFLNEMIAYVKTTRPRLVMGTKVMFFGFADKDKRKFVSTINQKTDAWMVTYYPLKSDFTVRNPKDVPRDMEWLVRHFPDKPLYFMEAGYPSGAVCASSEAKQAEFIRQLFRGWDRYDSRIGYVEITWLNDIPTSATDQYVQYYELEHPGFRGFLGTLGLRSWGGEGQDKAAFRALVEEANKRGWGNQ